MLVSRSSRARGLKQSTTNTALNVACVALFTGAWIETTHARLSLNAVRVALFTGAWIETFSLRSYKPETAESFCRDWLLLVTQTFVCVTSQIWSEIAKKQSHYPSPRQCDVNGFHSWVFSMVLAV